MPRRSEEEGRSEMQKNLKVRPAARRAVLALAIAIAASSTAVTAGKADAATSLAVSYVSCNSYGSTAAQIVVQGPEIWSTSGKDQYVTWRAIVQKYDPSTGRWKDFFAGAWQDWKVAIVGASGIRYTPAFAQWTLTIPDAALSRGLNYFRVAYQGAWYWPSGTVTSPYTFPSSYYYKGEFHDLNDLGLDDYCAWLPS
jgi:hypothetical protein